MSRTENQTLPLDTYGAAPQEISFFIVANGSSAPAVSAVGGCPLVASIVRNSAGNLTVKLTVPVFQVVECYATVDEASSPDGSTATIGPFTNEGTTTPLSFGIITRTSGSAADMAAGRKIRVRLRIKKSNWGKML